MERTDSPQFPSSCQIISDTQLHLDTQGYEITIYLTPDRNDCDWEPEHMH